MRARMFLWGSILCVVVICGCNQITRYKITSTIFDGVPRLPPAEQYCQDYHEQKLDEEKAAAIPAKDERNSTKGSRHAPFAAKRCNDCHDKSTENGLIRPKDQLCFVCHPKIIAGPYAHGPAAVGACLECHEPHSGPNPALLKTDKKTLCSLCHKEQRVARAMHARLKERGMSCTDCHDPHSGTNAYFLK